MANALTSIKPHEVSRDLSGYSVMFYGTPKSGKTTIASHFPGALVFAFERGYDTIPGIMAYPIDNWKMFRNALIDLRDEETKSMYKTIVIDTADIAYDYCTDYICQQNGVAQIKDIPFGGGYNAVGREFDTCIRKILQLNYGLVIISHSQDKEFQDEKGEKYNQIVPTLDKRGRLICERTCDIIGLSIPVRDDEGTVQTRLFLRETPRYVAGSRFKYIVDSIPFDYEHLVAAINDAIDKEAQETGNKYVTMTKQNAYEELPHESYNHDVMIHEFNHLVSELMTKDPNRKAQISQIISEYLGEGRKVSECTDRDDPQLDLILTELRRLS